MNISKDDLKARIRDYFFEHFDFVTTVDVEGDDGVMVEKPGHYILDTSDFDLDAFAEFLTQQFMGDKA